MIKLFHAINVLIPFIYGTSLGFYIAYFKTARPRRRRWAYSLLTAGIVIHVAFLVSKGIYFNYFPIANTFESMSMIALFIAAIYLHVERIRRESKTGVFFLTIVFAIQLLSSMFSSEYGTSSELLSNPMFGFHALFTMGGISGLAISAIYGLMYMMLAKQMKTHKLGIIYDRLPPLESLEKMGRWASVIGLTVLGFGIFLGHLWALKMLGDFFSLDPKIVITDIAW